MIDPVTQLIIRAFEHVDRSYVTGKLGSKFLEMLERDSKKKSADSPIDEDEEFAKKVKFLRECEENKDFCWLDYNSWEKLSFDFRHRFESVVEPLFAGSGIYFKFSTFHDRIRLFASLNYFDSIMFVLRDGSNYNLVCISSGSKEYNWMGTTRFKEILHRFHETLYISAANSPAGATVVYNVSQGGGRDASANENDSTK